MNPTFRGRQEPPEPLDDEGEHEAVAKGDGNWVSFSCLLVTQLAI